MHIHPILYRLSLLSSLLRELIVQLEISLWSVHDSIHEGHHLTSTSYEHLVGCEAPSTRWRHVAIRSEITRAVIKLSWWGRRQR